MKLAIVGYGKMGKLIEQFAPEFGFELALKLDIENNRNGAGITRENFRAIDVAVEFSQPDVAVKNMEGIAALGVNLVVGTTGWYDELTRVRDAVGRAGAGLVYGANFSVGMVLFSELVKTAGRCFREEPDYDAWAYEIHHRMKKDAPSGTLLKLTKLLEESGYTRRIDVSSNRVGMMPGMHQIGFDSGPDTITLTHTARNRLGFARGALRAAKWVIGKKGVYEFAEVLAAGG